MARRRGEHAGPSMLRVLAVALGVGVASVFVFDLHSHTCASCGRKWKHLGTFNEGDIEAHSCPKCGQVQWWKDGHCPDGAHVFPPDDIPAASSPAPPVLPPGPGSERT